MTYPYACNSILRNSNIHINYWLNHFMVYRLLFFSFTFNFVLPGSAPPCHLKVDNCHMAIDHFYRCGCETIFSPPRYLHPGGWKYRYDIFIPSTIFSPLTISNGKSFCSQISLNFIMCIYNKGIFYTFYDFLQIFVHHRLLIQSINISTKTLSFNSKEGIMLKYNHFNPPKCHGVNIWIWIIKPWYHCKVKFG